MPFSRQRSRFGLAMFILPLALLCAAPSATHADEDDQALPMVLLHVQALTRGLDMHHPEVPPPTPAAKRSEGPPLFGGTGEEPLYPVGQVDELIELVKTMVDPVTWESVRGAALHAQGEQTLLARAPRATLKAVAAFLARLERGLLRTARIEIRAVRIPDAGYPKEASARQRLIENSTGSSLSFLALDGQRVSAFSGVQHAYVGGYRTEVAQESATSEPLVDVANLGLIADATVSFGEDPTTARLRVRAHLSTLDAQREQDVGVGRTVEAPCFERTSASADLDLPVGTWRPIGGGHGSQRFWVRVSHGHFKGTPTEAVSLTYRPAAGGTFAPHILDLREFTHAREWRRCRPSNLEPSYFTPLEPPELPEPRRRFPLDNLVQLIRAAGPDRVWQDPASIEARGGHLVVRQTPAVMGGVRHVLDVVRNHVDGTIMTTVEVLDVPATLVRTLGGESAGAFALGADARAALTAALRDGEALRLESAELRSTPGVLNCALAGKDRRYVGGYGSMIAQGTGVSYPVIHSMFVGLRLTLTACRTSTPDLLSIQAEFQRTQHPNAIRSVNTAAGPVELPGLTMLRTRCGFIARPGQTLLLAAEGSGARRRIVLLTPRVVSGR